MWDFQQEERSTNMTVGEQLQHARKERRLSLSDITKETKIQPWVLEALEANRLQELMSFIYVKGFVTTYAKFLHLDPEPLMTELRPPAPVAEVPQPTQTSQPLPVVIHVPWPLLRRVGIAVAMSGAIAILAILKPIQRWGPKTSLHTINRPKVASVAPVSEPIKTPPPPPPQPIVPLEPLRLSLNVHRTMWIQVYADGKLVAQQRVQRGTKEQWLAKRHFELILANPSQVDLLLNGASISALAVAHHGRLKITHAGVTPLPETEP